MRQQRRQGESRHAGTQGLGRRYQGIGDGALGTTADPEGLGRGCQTEGCRDQTQNQRCDKTGCQRRYREQNAGRKDKQRHAKTDVAQQKHPLRPETVYQPPHEPEPGQRTQHAPHRQKQDLVVAQPAATHRRQPQHVLGIAGHAHQQQQIGQIRPKARKRQRGSNRFQQVQGRAVRGGGHGDILVEEVATADRDPAQAEHRLIDPERRSG